MKREDEFEHMLVSISAVAIGIIAYAWVMQAWWTWFLTPHGLGVISFTQAIVLRLAVVFIGTRPQFLADRPKNTLNIHVRKMTEWCVAVPASFWCLGWILNRWLPL